MIILDTSGLLAALDASEAHHERAAHALRSAEAPRILSPFVLAELDYLLSTRANSAVARAFLEEVARGAYRLEPFEATDIEAAVSVLERYPELGIGLADASLVVLAGRHGTTDILTLDERHFRVLRDPRGRSFRLLPADLSA